MTEEDYLADVRARQARARPLGFPVEPAYPLGEAGLDAHLHHWARAAPERVALDFYGRELTFAELDEASDRFAGWLDAAGVAPGERVAVHLGNCPQLAIAFHGILKLGAVYVPVNPLFRAHELTHELADSGAVVIVTLDALAASVEQVRGATALRELLVVALEDYLPDEPALPLPEGLRTPAGAGRPASQWERVLASPRLAPRTSDLDALAALNYTGGTMGLPKGCRHTQRHMLYTSVTSAAAWRLGERFGGTADDASVVFLPAFWIAGEDLALLLPVVTGTRCVLLARWDPLAVVEAVARHRATHLAGTVDSYAELLEDPRCATQDLSTLRMPLSASFVRKLDLATRRAWQARAGAGSVLRECAFGMTETHTMDTCTDGFQDGDRDLLARPVFCGLPMPGTDVKVVDFETGELLPIGAEGEIAIRSPSLFDGYWNAPEASAAALRDGWLHTGDVGQLDEDGCLHYLGRNKEMIKVKGMSVFPAELETLLGMHEDVEAIAVVPREDAERGQVPIAFVELAEGASSGAEQLVAWARANMATYKVPEVRVVAALPRTDTGKIKKGELLEHA